MAWLNRTASGTMARIETKNSSTCASGSMASATNTTGTKISSQRRGFANFVEELLHGFNPHANLVLNRNGTDLLGNKNVAQVKSIWLSLTWSTWNAQGWPVRHLLMSDLWEAARSHSNRLWFKRIPRVHTPSRPSH